MTLNCLILCATLTLVMGKINFPKTVGLPCANDMECGWRECCGPAEPDNSTATTTTPDTPTHAGICGKKPHRFQSCFVDKGFACPCRGNMLCVGTGKFQNPQGEIGICNRICRGSFDCEDSECCVGSKNRLGVCTARRKEFAICNTLTIPDPRSVSFALTECPCVSGLTCSRESVMNNPNVTRFEGSCRTPCSNSYDCDKDECCIKSGTKGYCEMLSKEDEACDTRASLYHNSKTFSQCPCAKGLSCRTVYGEDPYEGKCTRGW